MQPTEIVLLPGGMIRLRFDRVPFRTRSSKPWSSMGRWKAAVIRWRFWQSFHWRDVRV